MDEYTFISRYDESPTITIDGTVLSAPFFNEILIPESADIIGRYSEGAWYTGKPSVLLNKYGCGQCWTYGCVFTEDLVTDLLCRLGLKGPLKPSYVVPEYVEAAVRGDILFLLNYSDKDAEINIPEVSKDILTGSSILGRYSIPPFGVVALRNDRG